MKRTTLSGALVVAAIPCLAAAGVVPRYGGDLRVALSSALLESDPARATSPADLELAHTLHGTLLEIDTTGSLRTGLLDTVPLSEAGGRTFHLRLRPDLRFHNGIAVTSADVVASLSRLLQPQVRSPHGWIALAIEGSKAVREGKAELLSGVQALSDTELRITLDLAFPDFLRLLAAVPASIIPRFAPTAVGAGAFRLVERTDAAWRLVASGDHHRGRPYLDSVTLLAIDGRRSARAFSRGELDLALRPEALVEGNTPELSALTATYAVVNTARLGSQAEPIRRVLGFIDRAELIRLYVGGSAVPLKQLLPPSLLATGEKTPPQSDTAPADLTRRATDQRLVLLVSTGLPSLRPVADRIQVKLFDRGLRVSVQSVTPEALAARLASRDFDLAVTSLSLLSDRPAPAVLELAWRLGGPAIGQRVLTRLSAPTPWLSASLCSALEEELGAAPLFVRGLRVSTRPEIQGVAGIPDGRVDLGEVWLLPQRRSR